MGRRRELLVAGGLGAAAVVLAVVAVVSLQQKGEASDRQDVAGAQLAETESEAEQVQQELDTQQEEQSRLEEQLTALRQPFTPEAVVALTDLQTEMVEAGCTQARSAARDGTESPTGERVVQYAAVAGPEADERLQSLPESWVQLLDPGQIQSEIEACAADEAAVIQAEADAAAAEASAGQGVTVSGDTTYIDGGAPCDPSQLTIISPERGTYCVSD